MYLPGYRTDPSRLTAIKDCMSDILPGYGPLCVQEEVAVLFSSDF